MKVVIAGGTGFLGRPLARALAVNGHDIVILTRRAAAAGVSREARFLTWRPGDAPGPWAAEIDGAAAVINLAGESIAARRWSEAQKQRILESRVQATRTLADAILGASRPPAVFVSGSAVGYYGPRGDEIVTEEQPAGGDFLARVCAAWEAEATRAESAARVACIRTGLVIESGGGALPRMVLPFKFGAGGPLGSGRQYMPWIHRADWVALLQWTIATASAAGPINATAPNPVTNATFARALGGALRRPAFMPAPAFALRLALGEMADALLLSGQRAVPAKAERLGFRFRFTRLEDALAAIFEPQQTAKS
jgi:uncharacterized protein (TIGR01777 family)